DGGQGAAVLRGRLPDLVLMDVSMAVMGGFSGCAELRKVAGGGRVPVVMITGLDDVQSIERAFEVGATDFITKPINWPILAHRVRYMLRASTAINQIEQNHRRLSNAQRIGDMGDWGWDVRHDRIVPSEQAWHILGRDATAGSLTSDGFLASVHAEDKDRLHGACQHALATGDAFAIEHRLVQAGGATRHVHQQVEVLEHDESGRAVILARAIQDITVRRVDEERIRRLAHYAAL